MTRLTRFVRRLRFGPPIIVVSGLPRSGTSLLMQMLAAGGIELVTDGVRSADESNPLGYFELEAVKHLEAGGRLEWLEDARGRAVKVLSPLLPALPDTWSYLVLMVRRDLAEVIASQNMMLASAGQATNVMSIAELTAVYQAHLATIDTMLARRACFESLDVAHRALVERPREEAARIARFLRRPLALDRMAQIADPRLYRHRGGAPPVPGIDAVDRAPGGGSRVVP